MEELFIQVARVAGLLIEAAAVLIVTFGSVEIVFNRRGDSPRRCPRRRAREDRLVQGP